MLQRGRVASSLPLSPALQHPAGFQDIMGQGVFEQREDKVMAHQRGDHGAFRPKHEDSA